MMKDKPVEIAQNGSAYFVDDKNKTVKKVFNSFKELKVIADKLEEACELNCHDYFLIAKSAVGEKEIVRNSPNSFTSKGYRFSFDDGKIIVKDLLNFSEVVPFDGLPTPEDVVEILTKNKNREKFTPKEMKIATEKGKRLLEERSVVPIKDVVKMDKKAELEKARRKALRLITRIKNKQSPSKALLEEIPGMIKFMPVSVAIGIAISYYHNRKLRWGALVKRIENIIKTATFEKKPKKVEPFPGFDIMDYTLIQPYMDDESDIPKILVDGAIVEEGEFLIKFLLQKDSDIDVHYQLMKWVTGEITSEELLENPVKKDKTIVFDIELFKEMKEENVEVVRSFIAVLSMYNPVHLHYQGEEGLKFRKGLTIRLYIPQMGWVVEGKIHSTRKGIWVVVGGNDEYALCKKQHYKIIRK